MGSGCYGSHFEFAMGFRLVALRSPTYGEWESKNDSLIRTKNGIRLGLMQYKNL